MSHVANRAEWIIVGISGVTCGGKTSLANRLKEKLAPVYVFNQDKYFYPDDSPHHVKVEGMEHNNYDILSALDMEGMHRDIVSTLGGRDRSHNAIVSCPRAPHVFTSPGKKFLIIEGFTVLNYEPIINMCDLCYYFVLEFGDCAMRRSFRVYDPPDVPGYFERCVWPEHLKYRAMIEKDARVKIFDGRDTNSLDIVLSDVQALCKK